MLEHRRLWLRTWIGIAAAVSALAIEPAFAQEMAKWTVVETSGKAQEKGQDNNWRSLRQGDALAEGRLIETGGDGKLVLMHGKDLVTVAPNSAFEVPKGVNPATGPSFLERLGTLMFRIEHNPARHFEVDAPHLAAVVKGTVFTVTAGGKDNSVHVAEGAVQVTSALSHKVAVIRAGQTAIVSASGHDLSVIGHADTSKPAQKRSENDLPNGTAETANAATDAPTENKGPLALTATMGDAQVDVASVTHGLIGGDSALPGNGRSIGGNGSKSQVAHSNAGAGGSSSGRAGAGHSAGNPAGGIGGANPLSAGPAMSAAGGNPIMGASGAAAAGAPGLAGGNGISGGIALSTPAAVNSPALAGGPSTFNAPGTIPAAAGGIPNAASGNAGATNSGHGRH